MEKPAETLARLVSEAKLLTENYGNNPKEFGDYLRFALDVAALTPVDDSRYPSTVLRDITNEDFATAVVRAVKSAFPQFLQDDIAFPGCAILIGKHLDDLLGENDLERLTSIMPKILPTATPKQITAIAIGTLRVLVDRLAYAEVMAANGKNDGSASLAFQNAYTARLSAIGLER